MTDLFNRLDFYISMAGIGLVIFLWARRRWRALMSKRPTVPISNKKPAEHRSYAAEHNRELPGTAAWEPVPDLAAQLGSLGDDMLLDILARMRGADGDYRFAESRIAKFIPGRVEDRLAQVREVRHTEPPPPPGRQLRVRDEAGERLIPMDS